MKPLRSYYLFMLFPVLLFIGNSCNKYKVFNGDITLSGYAEIVDSLSTALPHRAKLQTLYLNAYNDTSTYIFQVKTDTLGHFAIPSLEKGKDYVLFTKFIRDNVQYEGALSFRPDNNPYNTVLKIFPTRYNGLSLSFTDSLNGATPHIPFRLYTSRVFATLDSAKYVYLGGSSDNNGQFFQYNLPPLKYYIVVRDSIGKMALQSFDSITIATNRVERKTVRIDLK